MFRQKTIFDVPFEILVVPTYIILIGTQYLKKIHYAIILVLQLSTEQYLHYITNTIKQYQIGLIDRAAVLKGGNSRNSICTSNHKNVLASESSRHGWGDHYR